MNVNLIQKIWLRCKNTIIAATIFLLIFSNMWISNALNPIPDQRDLKLIEVTINSSYMMNPHMRGKTAQGEVMDLLFPRPFNLTGRGSYFQKLSPEEQKQLIGCKANIAVTPINFSFLNQYRVWHFKCGEIELTYTDLISIFNKLNETQNRFLLFGYFAFFLIIVLGLYSERKR